MRLGKKKFITLTGPREREGHHMPFRVTGEMTRVVMSQKTGARRKV